MQLTGKAIRRAGLFATEKSSLRQPVHQRRSILSEPVRELPSSRLLKSTIKLSGLANSDGSRTIPDTEVAKAVEALVQAGDLAGAARRVTTKHGVRVPLILREKWLV
jgi:hypothetical protein